MNPQRDPVAPDPTDLDEAVSAFLDGEPVDEATRARPEFTDRLAELTRIRDAVRDAEPFPPLDDLTRRRLVRTAVDAATGGQDARTTSWLRRLGPLGAVAAGLAVVVVAGAVLLSGGDDGSDSASTSSDRTTFDDSGESGGGSDAAAPEATGVAPSDLGHLGDVSDLDALAAELLPAERDSAVPPDDAPQTADGTVQCSDQIRAVAPGPVLATGTGTFDGAAAVVIVTTDAAGDAVVLVATTDDCRVERAP